MPALKMAANKESDMTIQDYTPKMVKELKGQALRDCYERVIGRSTQSKDSSGLRDQILAELKKRAKAKDDAASMLGTVEAPAAGERKPTLAAQAKDAEEQGNFLAASRLWLEAAGEQTSARTKAKFEGRAAAAKVRADAQKAPSIAAALPEGEQPKPVKAPKAAKPAKVDKALSPEVQAARAMARALCQSLGLKVSVDDAGRWTFPTLADIENMDVAADKRADWMSLQVQLQVIEAGQPKGKAPKAKKEKAPKPEKAPVDKSGNVTSTAEEMMASLTDGQVLEHTFKDGREKVVVTVHRDAAGSLSFTDHTGKTWAGDQLYQLANHYNARPGQTWKVDAYLFFGLRKWKAEAKAAKVAKGIDAAALRLKLASMLGERFVADEIDGLDGERLVARADEFATAAKVLRQLAKVGTASSEPAREEEGAQAQA